MRQPRHVCTAPLREVAERAAKQGRLGEDQVIAILGQDENGDTVQVGGRGRWRRACRDQVEVLNQSTLRGVQGGLEGLEQAVLHTVTDDIQIEMETPDGSVQTITVPATSLPEHSSAVGRKRRVSGRVAAPQPKVRVTTVASRLATGEGSDETCVSLSFHCWLGSVTERINQTMHYQFDGHPEPLVFHAPQVTISPAPLLLLVSRCFSTVSGRESRWEARRNDSRTQRQLL